MNNQGRNEHVYNTSENNNPYEGIRYNDAGVFLSETSVFTSLPNHNASLNLNLSLGRNEQVYNTSENNNPYEGIRYNSGFVNTGSVDEIFSIPNIPSGMNNSVFLVPYIPAQTQMGSFVTLPNNGASINLNFALDGVEQTMQTSYAPLMPAPFMPAAQTHMTSFANLANHNASINLNSALGTSEQVYPSDGVEQTMYHPLTSSFVHASIANGPSRMIRDVPLSEAYYGPYMPASQTQMRSFVTPTNNDASINLNLALGLSSSTPTRVESHNRRTSPTLTNERHYMESMGLPLNLPLKRTLTQREIGGSSSHFAYASPATSYMPQYQQREIGASSHHFRDASSARSYMPQPQYQQREIGSTSNLFPYASSARSYIPEFQRREIGASYFPYVSSARSYIPEYQQREIIESSSHLAFETYASRSILEYQQRELFLESSSHLPFGSSNDDFPYATSSISEYQQIEIGENDEHRPHIRLRRDPEYMREVIREMTSQVEEQMIQARNERGLTEDEIMKHISGGNFEVPDEGTSENKEMCCICQEAFENGEEIGKLDCAHIFHMNCIKEWLSEKNICPLCKRRGLFVGDESDDTIDLC